jgi:hypothetical protein
LPAQKILAGGIPAARHGIRANNGVDAEKKVAGLLGLLTAPALDWLEEMAVWHSFTADQAAKPEGDTTKQQLLRDLTEQLCILRTPGGDGRYSMHVLVRAAAEARLKGHGRPELQARARQRLLRKMAATGSEVRGTNDAGIAGKARVLLPELGNVRRLLDCPAPGEANMESTRIGLWDLCEVLSSCGFYTEAVVVAQQVGRWEAQS